MATVYVLTFSATWVEDRRIVEGDISYPVTITADEMDMTDAISACSIVAAESGTILYPEQGVKVNTYVYDLPESCAWDDAGVRVY